MVMPARSRGAYSDTSGRAYGTCPRCTEVVTISPSGLVEGHTELLTEPLALGGPCPQGGHYIKKKEANT